MTGARAAARRLVVAGLALGLVAGPGLMTVVGVPAEAADSPETRCEVGRTQLVDDPQAAVNLERTGFLDTHELATGDGVTVAVVDTGVDSANPHLRDAVTEGTSFVGGSPTEDPYGHGTAIAGIIASRPVDGSVLVGGAPGATILPVRVIGEDAGTAAVADGIRWAAEQGADVINVSLSTGSSDNDLPALRAATKDALQAGAIIVAAAGNQTEDAPFTQVQYPAGIDGVIGVAATNASGAVDDWSVHGSHVDVAAPGANVLVAFRADGDCLVGLDRPYTSYATGYVSALAAQLVEAFPEDTPQEITNRLLATADRPRADERDDVRGWGTIQASAALTSSSNAEPGTVQAATATGSTSRVTPQTTAPDPMAPARTRMSWWALLMTGLIAIGLIVGPWVRRRSGA